MSCFLLERKYKKGISWMLFSIMLVELLTPNVAMALSSGPVQPEIQSFEPVGTTDMVDLFTGDFVYNIPLMDVEGYPLNISYHGGVTMDQEASWVGLGWNINPGAINRSVRGLPDEFNGEVIEKEVNLKTEITKKIGLEAVVEPVGLGQPIIKAKISTSLGGYLNISNYRGVSVDFTSSIGVNAKLFGVISAGLNLGASLGSQSGASVNYSKSLGLGISDGMSKELEGNGFNLNHSGVYSPRTGQRQSVGFNATIGYHKSDGSGIGSLSTGTSVPIGRNNFTAAITNPSYMNTGGGQLKVGGELFWIFGSAKCAGSITKIRYNLDGSRKGYGYFNLSEATDNDLTDFSREKDGMFNTTMQNLPFSNLTYDVYSVNGQGTGGSFRPFRNDIGSVFDPVTKSKSNDDELALEGGVGNAFNVGGEVTSSETKSESGPWKTSDCYRKFPKKRGGADEDIYFKEAGELTENNEGYLNAYANNTPVKPEATRSIPKYKISAEKRIVRANHIYTITGDKNDTALLLDGKDIVSYSDTTGFKNYPSVTKETIDRVAADTTKNLRRKKNHVTEIVQNQKDGRRYVYGLPVVNNVQREVTFAVDQSNSVDESKYLVDYTPGSEDSKNNSKGLDHFYSSSVTPTYVTAHLLTSVLSSDYIDVTGNGLSDDDLGTYTKFNYGRKSADYRWRSPIQSGKAQYNPGYKTDKKDDKGSYLIGSREQWMLHSVETKNYVAEFFVSQRQDALGVLDKITNGNFATYDQAPYNSSLSSGTKDNKSYKLDSIVLYNKHDRFTNSSNALPIKTVIFNYDYSLCKNVPNGTSGSGKLTLNKIQVKYGRSNLNMTAAYAFKYSSLNPDYDEAAKDRWSMYKPNDDAQLNNFEFPFTKQSSATNNYAGAWSLTEIGLPSGGVIKAEYESDDYAYVQNMEAMEMFKVEGFGSSAVYKPSDRLYISQDLPNLFFYFKRRKDAENPLLGPFDNYMKGSRLLYYNIATEISSGNFEPIKGYAEISDVGYCNADYGYVKVASRSIEGSGSTVNPVTYTALNTGRYNLPHILFPGSDPERSDMDNVVSGLKNSIKEMFQMANNPLDNMMKDSKGKYANFTKSFIRLTSPGLKKKGGGHRIKSVRFYDSWDAMAGGNQAVYGKMYSYTLKRDDGKGFISSGVASYEPMIGGDELPQRVPAGYYTVQERNNFPPNDAVDLYQELPLGESFYPGPVVGYSNVVVTSINKDFGRSSQTEDVSGFYTAKDFPIQTNSSPINIPNATRNISLLDVTIEQEATQGYSFVFNDMHGKPRNTEHYVLKPADTIRGRELVTMQKYEYQTKDGKLDNMVPVFDYNPLAGKMSVVNHKMGIETELTLDTRMREEKTETKSFSGNLNASWAFILLLPIPLAYPFSYDNNIYFRSATTSKVTQQYGILNKVTSSNEGAVTEVRNEVFDINTGNALVTSVNNEFKDREYNVSYPAYWAYKELGPCYQNHDFKGTFTADVVIDTLGSYAERFVNYNPAFSTQYHLPSNMPVAKIIVDEDMPKYKLGDEMLLTTNQSPVPIRTWTMGYTSDIEHCYLVLTTREPYKTDAIWSLGASYSNVNFRVIKSGLKNRLGETIQSYTTTNRSNIFPFLKDSLSDIIGLNAQTYKYNLNQVFAPNMISDSLNPFITGKVGLYRPQNQILNLKNRNYTGGTARNAGMFTTPSYWKTELDVNTRYCPDSVVCTDCPAECPTNPILIDRFTFSYLGQDIHGNDSFKIKFTPFPNPACSTPQWNIALSLWGGSASSWPGLPYGPFGPHPIFNYTTNNIDSVVYKQPSVFRTGFDCFYSNGCCQEIFHVSFDGTTFTITNPAYYFPGTSTVVTMTNTYIHSPLYKFIRPAGTPVPIWVRKKIYTGNVGHYDGTDNEKWIKTQQVTKYNWFGQELENKEEGIGYNAAIYGYNQQLPMCVAKNAMHHEVLYESFEDYALLKPRPDKNESYMPLIYSPFEPFFNGVTTLNSLYKVTNLSSSALSSDISKDDAHTGNYSLKVNFSTNIPLNPEGVGMANGYSFKMAAPRKYVASLWLKPTTPVTDARTAYFPNGVAVAMDTVLASSLPSGAYKVINLVATSNIIEGWQKFEATFDAPLDYKSFKLQLAGGYYFDDIRLFPFESNSKGFVYEPVSRKLMATLDENNFATFYEYDAEGNLVRTKKETEKGILTITESRSTHRKAN